ncbi:hypothetical protein C7271_24610 [filamentous cyanobacterium CCP5]|nr:hypothetical protein C7271_24610 [filamentous cyanobacterium CCP5]
MRHPGPGSPLPASTRRRIEPHVGANLSGVRVHSDASTHRATSSLQARAFTHRNHIFLNRAESSSDLALMAHESTHVVQQGASDRNSQGISRQPQPGTRQRTQPPVSSISTSPTVVQAKTGDAALHPMQSRIVNVAKSKVGLIEAYTDSGEKREVGGQTINVRKGGDRLLAIIQETAPGYAATETQQRDLLNVRVLIGPGPDVDPKTPGRPQLVRHLCPLAAKPGWQ